MKISKLLIIIIEILAVGLVTAFLFNLVRNSPRTNQPLANNHKELMPDTARENPPVLKNLGIDFDNWDVTKNKVDEFSDKFLFFLNKPLIEFGTKVIGEQQKPKLLPEITYVLPKDTKIISPISGKVELSVIGWSGDYTVNIKKNNSEWLVSFEHVINLSVEDNGSVMAGDVIGRPSITNLEGTGFGFTELVVWRGGATPDDIIKICPFTALQEDLKPIYEEKIKNLVKEWEEVAGKNAYDESLWVYPGCLFEDLTESDALRGKKRLNNQSTVIKK